MKKKSKCVENDHSKLEITRKIKKKCIWSGPNSSKIFGQFQNRFRLIEGQGISFLIHKIEIEKLSKEQKSLSKRCDILINLI